MAEPAPSTAPRSALWWGMSVLFVMNMMNYFDRSIFAVAQEPIKAELKLSDLQLGLIGGPAFAVLYTVFSFPLALLADRRNRVTLISAAFICWSVMTAFCGIAGNFIQMIVGRAGVSIGEAGCTPASHSFISDYFPPDRRTTAISVFTAAGPIGSLLAGVGGGMMVQAFGWRPVFLACGAAGVALAILLKLALREPPRATPPRSMRLHAALAYFIARPSFMLVAFGGAVANVANFANHQYLVSFLIRTHGSTVASAAALAGAIVGVSSFAMFFAGFVMDRGNIRHPRIRIWLPAITMMLCGLVHMLAFQGATLGVTLALLFAASVLQSFYMPAMFSLGQEIVPPYLRAMASAIIIAVISIVGYGMGPPLMGWLSDLLGQWEMARHGLNAAQCEILASAACKTAASQGLRLSLTLGSGFFILGGALFSCAAIGIRRDLVSAPISPSHRTAAPRP